ncbi:MAG: hypothetical protein COW73_00020 [Nitrospirae bacterium CG18_big_fil_WC_8_21_14_2_50_70_55]|nr:hypothetical protein [Deltaproteobacteria bacterium]OIP65639.1 MAG: hypothetical protein AUK30_04255 [Nitrospirae bacterium CG2_30_70_394]PIQ07302.1 MAG: hypothetical protein COW73_00020 [Nitrospirae bacterium CG18_big_fil_WC_8_21_14_2_50_70_55]PIU80265.1 MAG: hypothetical protein COS73_00215 [Nitrospirae bacterium CG06_land_8_20_14_3_00_70_43]PIW82723.1 MAG: hypothetical protein COZ96_07325 [Nitrospirae bacterium CG_4_8_14_3_um_filter_70_85]PIX83072.1 MAG: hypothetical protein COZ33_07265 
MTNGIDVELDGILACQWVASETGTDEVVVSQILGAFTRYLCQLGLAEVERQGDGTVDVTLILPGE